MQSEYLVRWKVKVEGRGWEGMEEREERKVKKSRKRR